MNACSGSRKVTGLPTFRQFQRELDQLFDGALPFAAQTEAGLRGKVSAPVTLSETADHIVMEMELPGLKQEDVDITIDKNLLKVTAERRAVEGERKVWHQERVFGKIERVVSLPETVATDEVDAELHDGVLVIRLPKRPEVQPKKVVIRGTSGEAQS